MELLGRGGFGEVVALDENHVAKIQKNLKEYDPGVSCAVLREILAMSVVDDGKRMGRVLLESGTCAMEIKRYDETLLGYIRRSKASGELREKISIFSDIVNELFTVHSLSIAHRDLKPENVMLKRRAGGGIAAAHIIDWGMSRVMNASIKEWNAWTPGVTTVWYRAPELFTGDEYGLAVDVWSLGILLVELLTGVCPFRGRTEVMQIREYIEVLGLPTKGALPNWPYQEVAMGHEPDRTELWDVMPAIRESGLGEIIDKMIRWDMRQRITLEELVIRMKALRIGSTRLRPAPVSRVSMQTWGSMRGKYDHIRIIIKRIIFPLGVKWKLNAAVLWTATLIVMRVLQTFKEKLRPQKLTMNVIACVDLANKLVGSQDLMILRKLKIEDGRQAQVAIVNHCLGIHGIRPVVFACPPILVNESILEYTSSQGISFYPLYVRALLDSMLFGKTWRSRDMDWESLGQMLVHIGNFAVKGQMLHYKRFVKTKRRRRGMRMLWRKVANDMFTYTLDTPPKILKLAHPYVFKVLSKDQSIRSRLEFILS
jgi:serine/threonine protein kinase